MDKSGKYGRLLNGKIFRSCYQFDSKPYQRQKKNCFWYLYYNAYIFCLKIKLSLQHQIEINTYFIGIFNKSINDIILAINDICEMGV